jgi:hypothetical protein
MYGCGSFVFNLRRFDMHKKSKAGRKPIGDRPMSDRLTIRLSGTEMRAVRLTAQEHGYRDVAKFMRGLLLGSPQVKHAMKELTNQ